MDKLGVVPKLRLAEKNPKGGVTSTGPHRVRFLGSKLVDGTDPEKPGKVRQEIHYRVDENGVEKVWIVPILNKQGQPNYLLERISEIADGEEVILETKRSGAKNYTSVVRIANSFEAEDDEQEEEKAEEKNDD